MSILVANKVYSYFWLLFCERLKSESAWDHGYCEHEV